MEDGWGVSGGRAGNGRGECPSGGRLVKVRTNSLG